MNDLTFMYVNGLLDVLNEDTRTFILDERNHFLPAGLARFARNSGGHLEDDPHKGRVATVRQVEQFVTEFVTVEQGMMLQNLGLMAQALGLGGFPNFANHEFAAIAAATAHCECLWQRYGRFPVYMPPFRTVLNFQACHLDADFYEKFYRPETLGETQRNDSATKSLRLPAPN